MHPSIDLAGPPIGRGVRAVGNKQFHAGVYVAQ